MNAILYYFKNASQSQSRSDLRNTFSYKRSIRGVARGRTRFLNGPTIAIINALLWAFNWKSRSALKMCIPLVLRTSQARGGSYTMEKLEKSPLLHIPLGSKQSNVKETFFSRHVGEKLSNISKEIAPWGILLPGSWLKVAGIYIVPIVIPYL